MVLLSLPIFFVLPFKNFFASSILSLYLTSFMKFTQGPLHRLISYNKQGLDLLLNVPSEQLLNKNEYS